MRRRDALLMIAALAACRDSPPARVTYDDRYRPLYHFTPARNWMNDPNGLIYYEGEYHLFFQHNPHGADWGHLSWGHAVSADLVNWRELALAIPEREVMIFSGSAVIDWRNTSGLGAQNTPPMIAIYTGYNPRDHSETQNLSFSLDRGRSWRAYIDNPILAADRGGMFRDPKVFWHEPTQRWVMIVARSDERIVSFFVSDNLRDWREASSFGPAGAVSGPWEVPDLFEVPLERGGSRWVLVVGVTGNAGVAGGSGMQYFIGDFDGRHFTAEGGARVGEANWVDYGADFYAPQSWSGIPAADGRRIWIAWLSNTRYANDTPTQPWRGMLTLPRTVHVTRVGGRSVLVQRPVRELESLRRDATEVRALALNNAMAPLQALAPLGEALEMNLTLRVGSARETGVVLHFGESEVRVGYDGRIGHVFVDRTRGGDFAAEGFRARHYAPVTPRGGLVELRIFLDRSSIEVFAQDGARVLSDLLFPTERLSSVDFFATGGAARLERLQAWRLEEMAR